jgi:hypothetical protein
MHLFLAAIGLIFAYLALDMIIHSRSILETDSEKRKQFGTKLMKTMYLLMAAGVAIPLFIILRPDMWQTYTLVGINLILLGVNGIFVAKPLKEPEANHTTLGRNAKIISQISKYLAIVLITAALVWAAWPMIWAVWQTIRSLICQ